MEFALAFLVLSQVVSHLLIETLLLLIEVRLDRLVVAFAFVKLNLDFRELIS